MTPAERKPEIVGWEITNQCNLSCAHCFTAAGRRAHGEMTTEECRSVVEAMARIGVGAIGWTGGEPLIRDDLEELIAYARKFRIKSTVTTNAILLDRERAEKLVESGNRAVQISLDGSTAERNRRMRGATEEEFDRIIDAIRICKELNTTVLIATVLGRENLDDVPSMIELAKREGVDTIRFCGYAPVGRGKRSDIRERFRFDSALERLSECIQQAQAERELLVEFDIGFGPTPPDFGFHTCIAGVGTFYLKATGDVYPCTSLTFPQFLVGNVREKSLEEIWESSEMRAVAEYPRERLHGDCPGCDNFGNCHAACRGVTFAHTGDVNGSFPLCLYKVARARKGDES